MSTERFTFDVLPPAVVNAITTHTGPITTVAETSSGFNSEIGARITTKTGNLFVKGMRTDHPRAWTQQREADTNPHVQGVTPALRWRVQTEGWDVLGFDAINGPHADYADTRNLVQVAFKRTAPKPLGPRRAALRRAVVRRSCCEWRMGEEPGRRAAPHRTASEVTTAPQQPPGQAAFGSRARASLLGDRTAVDRLLDEATGLLDRVDDELPWGNACRRTPGYLEVQRATCYTRMGLGVEASDLWAQVLGPVPSTARRDRGVYLARHAAAAASAREPDQAVEIGREAAVIAIETGSARMRRELADLERAMRPGHDAPVGQELAEILALVTERG